jgi:hypothetical protein
MSNTFTLSADVSTNAPESALGLEVWLNNKLINNIDPVVNNVSISLDIDDSDGDHELKFVLKNKTHDHTKVDEAGNIVQDAVIEIRNLKFDEIELGQIFYDQSVYQHNFNGTGEETQQQFYGTMGCNGSVSLKFTTPMYLWLLERM